MLYSIFFNATKPFVILLCYLFYNVIYLLLVFYREFLHQLLFVTKIISMYVILGKKYFYEQILEKIDSIYRNKKMLEQKLSRIA